MAKLYTIFSEPRLYAEINSGYLYGNKAKRYQRWVIFSWLFALCLAIVSGFALGIIGTVAINTVLASAVASAALPVLLIVSGLVVTVGTYAYFLKESIASLWIGLWQSVRDALLIKQLMKDTAVRQLLLRHFLRVHMSRSLNHRRTARDGIDDESLKIFASRVTAGLSEKRLEELLQLILLAARDTSCRSPVNAFTHVINKKIQQLYTDPAFKKEIRRKQWALTAMSMVAFIAGFAFGAVMFTHALQGLNHITLITQLGPAAVPTIAALGAGGVTLIFGFFLMNSFRQTLLKNFIQDFIRSSYHSLRPHGPLTSAKGWGKYLAQLTIKLLPFILLALALALVTYSACGLLIHSSTTALVYMAQVIPHVIPQAAPAVQWVISHHLFSALSYLLIGGFFVPTHLFISFVYSSEAMQRMYKVITALFNGKFKVRDTVSARLKDYETRHGLFFKDMLRAVLVTGVVLLLTINLIGKAAVPSEFVKLETGSLKLSLIIAAMDFLLQWLSAIPFLLGGKDKHHDHGAGLAGSTITVLDHAIGALLPERTMRRWQANHLSPPAQVYYEALRNKPQVPFPKPSIRPNSPWQQPTSFLSWAQMENRALTLISEQVPSEHLAHGGVKYSPY